MNHGNIQNSKDYFNNIRYQGSGVVKKSANKALDEYLEELSEYKREFSRLSISDRSKACGLYFNTLSDAVKTECITETHDAGDILGLIGQLLTTQGLMKEAVGKTLLKTIERSVRRYLEDDVNDLAQTYYHMPIQSVDVEYELDRIERARDMKATQQRAIG